MIVIGRELKGNCWTAKTRVAFWVQSRCLPNFSATTSLVLMDACTLHQKGRDKDSSKEKAKALEI